MVSLARSLYSRSTITGVILAWLLLFVATIPAYRILSMSYSAQESSRIKDRNGILLRIQPNSKGFYAELAEDVPPRVAELLLAKEDQWFFYHPGVHPVRIAADFFSYLSTGKLNGSSTLTQQLAKNLLGNENRRTIKNKMAEAWYALALELHAKKNEIITIYANTA